MPEKNLSDDPAFAAVQAEFEAAFPGWWFLVEERQAAVVAIMGPMADADDLRIVELASPLTGVDALRAAMRRVLQSK